MGFATGSATVQTNFALPANLPAGTYQVAVVANGIASTTVNLTVSGNQSGVSATAAVTSQWESGYCATVTVTNQQAQTINHWTVVMDIGTATINAQWQANFTQSGSTLTATNASNNGTLAPGAQTTFGFCTQMPAPVRGPVIRSASGS
jgi:cellulase/cellobiase CelA1